MLDLSQRDLAKKIGVSMHTIWRWENNKIEPRASKLRQMAKLFGCKIADLVESGDEVCGPEAT
jgi:transcriptional regulator with XRE-family HTH domain